MENKKSVGGRPKGRTTAEETDLVARVVQASGKSIVDFADEWGASVSAVSKWVNLKRGPGTITGKKRLAELAKKYGVQV